MHAPQKPILNTLFIGHVDAGKSTIIGQILTQLNLIDQRTLEKYKQESAQKSGESWYLAYIMDTNPEERDRGKTTELGKAKIELNHKFIILLDSPGHKSYITHMISGASQADIAVLVVSARKGEFESGIRGQTNEHILLARAGGIRRMVVLVNKMDEVCGRERYDEIVGRIRGMTRMFGVVVFVPISGYLGVNVRENVGKIGWYDGPSFLEYLDGLEVEREDGAGAVFMVTERVKSMGSVFLAGKVESGVLRKGESVVVLPVKRKTSVVGIYDDEECEIEVAYTGDNVRVKLKDTPEDSLFVLSVTHRKKDYTRYSERSNLIHERNVGDQNGSSDENNALDENKVSAENNISDENKVSGINANGENKVSGINALGEKNALTENNAGDENKVSGINALGEKNALTENNAGDENKVSGINANDQNNASEEKNANDENNTALINNKIEQLTINEKEEIPYKACNTFTAMFSVINTKNIITPGYTAILHIKNAQRECEILEIRTKIKEKIVKQRFARKGDKVLVKIRVKDLVVLYAGDDPKKKDWFCVRDEELTVGVGVVRNVIDK